MGCRCNYPPLIRASGIAVATGVTTITVPSTVEIVPGGVYNILLATPIPEGTDGTQISVTNGTVTGTVMKSNGNYARANPLTSRSVLLVQFFDDPAHFQILRPRW